MRRLADLQLETAEVEAPAKALEPEKTVALVPRPAEAVKSAVAPLPPAEKSRPAAEKKAAPEKVAMAERPAKPTSGPRVAPTPVAEKPEPEASGPVSEKTAPKTAEPGVSNNGDKLRLAAEAYQRGNAKLLSGALPEAIAAFSEAIKLNPRDAPSQRGLGLAYAQSGKAALAVRHLKLYLKAAPHAPDRALIEKRIEQLSGR